MEFEQPIINEKQDPKIVIQTMTQKQKNKILFYSRNVKFGCRSVEKMMPEWVAEWEKKVSWPQNIKDYELITKNELENDLGFKLNKRNLLITFHPVTLEHNTSKIQFGNLLYVLSKQKNTKLIFTRANSDTFGQIINQMIKDYVKIYSQSSIEVISLGRLKYLSLLQFVDAVVGNSSSGIIEAPSFQIGTINIGDRQQGRLKAESVIDCPPTREGIKLALKNLYSSGFQKDLKHIKNPYEKENGIKIMLKATQEYLDNKKELKKGFFDLSFDQNKK